jgi:hypothetical protein
MMPPLMMMAAMISVGGRPQRPALARAAAAEAS